jgi:hypothetical protein
MRSCPNPGKSTIKSGAQSHIPCSVHPGPRLEEYLADASTINCGQTGQELCHPLVWMLDLSHIEEYLLLYTPRALFLLYGLLLAL